MVEDDLLKTGWWNINSKFQNVLDHLYQNNGMEWVDRFKGLVTKDVRDVYRLSDVGARLLHLLEVQKRVELSKLFDIFYRVVSHWDFKRKYQLPARRWIKSTIGCICDTLNYEQSEYITSADGPYTNPDTFQLFEVILSHLHRHDFIHSLKAYGYGVESLIDSNKEKLCISEDGLYVLKKEKSAKILNRIYLQYYKLLLQHEYQTRFDLDARQWIRSVLEYLQKRLGLQKDDRVGMADDDSERVCSWFILALDALRFCSDSEPSVKIAIENHCGDLGCRIGKYATDKGLSELGKQCLSDARNLDALTGLYYAYDDAFYGEGRWGRDHPSSIDFIYAVLEWVKKSKFNNRCPSCGGMIV